MIWLLIAAIAVSYGWGMRGTLLGHGKGAMLPGALLGICIAYLSGNPIMSSCWLYFAAVGAAAMYFGGGMTYGQTIGLVIKRNEEQRFWHGVFGLSLKGFMWFGLAAAYMAFATQAFFNTTYSTVEIILAALVPIGLGMLGDQVFNRPWDQKAGRYPKIYFSLGRRESWGGYLFAMLGICLLAVVNGDWFTVLMALIAGIGGAFGWFVAILFYYVSEYPLKNGKYLFGKLKEKKLIGGWKIMECTLGAIGGLMTCVAFLIARAVQDPMESFFRNALSSVDPSLPIAIKPAISGALEWILIIVWLALAVFDMWFERSRFGEKYDELASNVANGDTLSQAIFGNLSLLLVMLGSYKACALTAGALIFWVVAEKMCVESLKGYKGLGVITVWAILSSVVLLVLPLANVDLPLWVYVILYTVVYETLSLIKNYRMQTWQDARQNGLAATYGSRLTVDSYFVLTIILSCLLILLNA